MSTEILCRRYGPALQAANEQGADAIRKIAMGEQVMVKITRPRNPDFHRKYFALLSWAFDQFEPEPDTEFEAKYGMTPVKNFDRFRKDIAILAGYREAHYNVKGEVRVEAKSISFASMSEQDFADMYSKTIDVLWTRIFANKEGYTRQELDNVIAQLDDFS